MLFYKLGHSLKETGGFSLAFMSDGQTHFGEGVRQPPPHMGEGKDRLSQAPRMDAGSGPPLPQPRMLGRVRGAQCPSAPGGGQAR